MCSSYEVETRPSFARAQLEKYGWKEGLGLGAENEGINRAISVTKKNDNLGVRKKKRNNSFLLTIVFLFLHLFISFFLRHFLISYLFIISHFIFLLINNATLFSWDPVQTLGRLNGGIMYIIKHLHLLK